MYFLATKMREWILFLLSQFLFYVPVERENMREENNFRSVWRLELKILGPKYQTCLPGTISDSMLNFDENVEMPS